MHTSGTATNDPQKRMVIQKHEEEIFYSARYSDDLFEYRHVILPKEISQYVPKSRLMPEQEWRGLGVRQSPGWEHYMIHDPEPHILLFRRVKDTPAPVKTEAKNKTGGLVG